MEVYYLLRTLGKSHVAEVWHPSVAMVTFKMAIWM
jgi:hypothetical protein